MDEEQASRVVCELYETWYPNLVRYAYRSLGALGMAEDVVQEAFMELYKQLANGASIEHPSAWTFSVARRRIGREVRHHLETTALHDSLDVLESVSQGQVQPLPFALDGSELLRVSDLSRREEEVLLLRMESLKYREIGRILGISSNSVGTLITRALHKLRSLSAEQPREKAKRRETL
jgi:RNA polymerase sigma factor (sigma-70 family)